MLDRHQRLSHLPWYFRSFLCQYCQEGFASAQRLKNHIATTDHFVTVAQISHIDVEYMRLRRDYIHTTGDTKADRDTLSTMAQPVAITSLDLHADDVAQMQFSALTNDSPATPTQDEGSNGVCDVGSANSNNTMFSLAPSPIQGPGDQTGVVDQHQVSGWNTQAVPTIPVTGLAQASPANRHQAPNDQTTGNATIQQMTGDASNWNIQAMSTVTLPVTLAALEAACGGQATAAAKTQQPAHNELISPGMDRKRSGDVISGSPAKRRAVLSVPPPPILQPKEGQAAATQIPDQTNIALMLREMEDRMSQRILEVKTAVGVVSDEIDCLKDYSYQLSTHLATAVEDAAERLEECIKNGAKPAHTVRETILKMARTILDE